MKKLFLTLVVAGMSGFGLFGLKDTKPVYAEENEIVEVSSEEINSIENEEEDFDLESYLLNFFDAKTVATIMSYVAYLGTIVGLAVKLKSLKSKNQLTLEKAVDLINNALKENVSKDVAERFDKLSQNLLKTTNETIRVLKDFSKVLALSQENTAESRVAILEILSKIGLIEQEVVDEAKEIVENDAKQEKENKVKAIEQLDNIIENSNEEEPDEEKENAYDGTTI